jgi:hypothetical protein
MQRVHRPVVMWPGFVVKNAQGGTLGEFCCRDQAQQAQWIPPRPGFVEHRCRDWIPCRACILRVGTAVPNDPSPAEVRWYAMATLAAPTVLSRCTGWPATAVPTDRLAHRWSGQVVCGGARWPHRLFCRGGRDCTEGILGLTCS